MVHTWVLEVFEIFEKNGGVQIFPIEREGLVK